MSLDFNISFIPDEVSVRVRPLRWFEWFMPTRWSKERRTIRTFSDLEIREISFMPPRIRSSEAKS